jgi:hypothetical protein
MGDLTYIQRDGEIQIVGQDATGNQVNYVSADINGNLLVKDYSDGPVTPGTVAAVSSLIGGQFNTTLPTLTNTQQSAIQLDSIGRVIVLSSNFPLVVDTNYGTVGASTLRTAAEIGNATGAASFNYGAVSAQTLRTASQIGNATGAADFNAGATTAQTLRTTSNISDGAGTALTSTLIGAKQSLDVSAQGNVASGVADAGNPVKIGAVYNTTLPTPATGQRVNLQADLNGRLLTADAPLDGYKATYSASVTDLTVAAAATDIFTLTGSATKTIRITHFSISGTETTAKQFYDVIMLKRSTANTLGTSTTRTAVPYDSADAAATATVSAYTANPTLGTLVGNLSSVAVPFCQTVPSNAQSNGDANTHDWEFGTRPSKALVVRGTSEVVAINLAGQTINGGSSIDLYVEWTEE